jgi:hypothetical protein
MSGLVWDPFEEVWIRPSAMEMLTLVRSWLIHLQVEEYLMEVAS